MLTPNDAARYRSAWDSGPVETSTTEMARTDWEPLARAHADRVAEFIRPHQERNLRRIKHPVHDFMFVYYSHRPQQLQRWHPGFGVRLVDAPEYERVPGYCDGTVSTDFLASRRQLLMGLSALLGATAAREGNDGCFGLHEWAMVYRQDPKATRHNAWPLRLGAAGTDTVVESHRIACSHFDAFRFFTPEAKGLNTLSPDASDRPDFEQPSCLHANMDLYKHAFRLSPLVPSELVLRAFELAREIRALDMRASPYDLSELPTVDGEDWSPVRIETPAGKRYYAARQREFAGRAAPLRAELMAWCERLLASHRVEDRTPVGGGH